ncbi:MAG: phytanoyl-CoA dioxygenase family protein [Archangiaceae bacterium]|nr:phytanoyl-CoA dioxygenase family protein [Archangiaceae bacterium]
MLLLPQAAQMDLSGVLAHYAEHGWAKLGRVVSDAGLTSLRERAVELMLGRVAWPGMFFQMDSATGRHEDAPLGLGWQGPSLSYRKLEKLELDPKFSEWIRNPLHERIARARIDGPVVLYRCILFNKAAEGGSDIPWHQDGGKLWGLSQDPELQVWTALDDAPLDGGCLEVVDGSHAWGLATALGGVVPENRVLEREAEARALALPVAAGESVLVHNMLWHRSKRTQTGARRLGLSVCYMSGATRCLRKKRTPRVFVPVF